MAESVYKVIELIGTSKESWEKAAAAAVGRAGKSLRDLRVAEIVKLDLQLDAKGEIEAYRAKGNLPCRLEDRPRPLAIAASSLSLGAKRSNPSVPRGIMDCFRLRSRSF